MTNEQAVDEVMAQVAALSPENAAIIKDPEAWLNAKFDALRDRAEKAEAEAGRLVALLRSADDLLAAGCIDAAWALISAEINGPAD